MKNNESPDRMKLTGVYCIRHIASGKVYVGSAAKSFASRLRIHLHHLRHGKHHSALLQRAWSKYGEAAFVFVVAEFTAPEHAVCCEQMMIDFYRSANPSHGYNISPTAASSLGTKHTLESRVKIVAARKRQLDNPEAVERFSAAQKRRSQKTERREAVSIHFKKFYADSVNRSSLSKRSKLILADPEKKKVWEINHTASLQKTETRAKMSQSRKAYFAKNPEALKSLSRMSSKRMEDPDERKKASEAMNAVYADPVRRAAMLLKNRITRASKKLVILQEQP